MTDSGGELMDKIGAARRRLTRWPMIVIAKEKRIDNETRVGGIGGMGRACTQLCLLTMTVCQTYKGTREGSHKEGNQLANSQRDEGRGAAQWSFSSGRKLSALAVRPVVRASGSLPREHS